MLRGRPAGVNHRGASARGASRAAVGGSVRGRRGGRGDGGTVIRRIGSACNLIDFVLASTDGLQEFLGGYYLELPGFRSHVGGGKLRRWTNLPAVACLRDFSTVQFSIQACTTQALRPSCTPNKNGAEGTAINVDFKDMNLQLPTDTCAACISELLEFG